MAIIAVVSAKGTAGVLSLQNAAAGGFFPGLGTLDSKTQAERDAIAEAAVTGAAGPAQFELFSPEPGAPVSAVVPAPAAITSRYPEIPNLAALVAEG